MVLGLALVLVLAIIVGCKASIGGSSSPGAGEAHAPPDPVAATPEVKAARSELLAVINAGMVVRCRDGEATDAAAEAACAQAEGRLVLAAAPAVAPVEDRFDVVLVGTMFTSAESMDAAVRAVAAAAGLAEADARKAIDGAPALLASGRSRADADALLKQVNAIRGLSAEVRVHAPAP